MGLSINMNKSGIKAHQLALDAISNNIANATTEGYKAKGVRFRTLMNNPITEDDVLLNNIDPQISAGATSAVAVTDFSSGSLSDTRINLDLAHTENNQFFAVQNEAGETLLTKGGSFTVDGTGRLVNNNGHHLVFDGAIPQNLLSNDISISSNGTVSMNTGTDNSIIGNVSIYTVANPQTLQPVGENYFQDVANQSTLTGNANIEVTMLEMSNVDLAQELTNMIVAQRAYSLNIKMAQSTDEMMSNINQFSV